MKNKNFFACVSTNIGVSREENQDNFYFNGKIKPDDNREHIRFYDSFNNGIFAVADGMGGHSHGDFASKATVTEIENVLANEKNITITEINRYIDSANSIICRKMNKCSQRIGSTFVLANISGFNLKVFNIGDSKCLLFRNGEIVQISRDHNVEASLLASGVSKELASKNPKRKHLTQHLGIFPEEMLLSVYESENITLEKDDVIVLCSDGVTDALSNSDIAQIIKNCRRPQRLSNDLVFEAINKGSRDNVTALTITVGKAMSNMLEKVCWILGGVLAAAAGVAAGLALLSIF